MTTLLMLMVFCGDSIGTDFTLEGVSPRMSEDIMSGIFSKKVSE